MSTSNKYALKIVTTLCMVVFFLSLSASSANAISTAEDINGLAEMVKLTTNAFMQESFQFRMGYEYSGKFLTQNDKEKLRKLAKRASNHLQEIAKNQKELKQQIEDYRGPDWDNRYGASGLWRKLFAELYTTTLSKCEIDFYLALTANQPQRNNILHKILAQIDSLNQTHNAVYSQFLKAKTLALLARSEPAYKPLAIEQLDSLCKHKADISDAIYFRAVIEKIKLAGQTEPGQLNSLAEELGRSSCADELELALSVAFLQRRLKQPGAFKKIVHIWPQTEDFLGSVILSELSYAIESGQLNKLTLQQTSVFEAELAAQAAWKNETGDHKTLLDCLSSTEKFQTPSILYVAAITVAESSPTKAVNLLVKASSLQQLQKSNKLDVEGYKIAGQAAQLAYNLFAQDLLNCQLALEAFENYHTLAAEKIDEELEYLYSIVLNDCGRTEKGKKLLQKIASKSVSNWRNKAKLDLITQQIQQESLENQDRRNEVLKQLSNLIAECTGQNKKQNKIRTEAITIYCQLLLESKDRVCAQKVLNILTDAEIARDPNLNVFKSKALRHLDKLDESAHCLLGAIEPNCCKHAEEAMELLSEIIDEIDKVQEQADDFDKMVQNCKRLAEFCYGCLDGPENRQAGLFLAEIATLAAAKEKNELLAVEKLLNNLVGGAGEGDVDLLRCRARLFGEQSKFGEAAELWAKVAKIRKSKTLSANQRSWKWWRAKFYELYYWAKCPQTKKKEVLHTIEVLENSFQNIPALWAEKLSLLKQQCRNQLISTNK